MIGDQVNKRISHKILLGLLDNLIWILIAIAVVGFSLATNSFFKPFNLVNIIPRVAGIALLVIGQSFTLITGHFDLSSESALGITAMVGGLLLAAATSGGYGLQLSTWIVIPIMLLGGLLIGLINGLLITKLKANNLITTIAMLMVLRGLVYIIAPGVSTSQFPSNFDFFGVGALFKLHIGTQSVAVPFSNLFVLIAFAVAFIVTRYRQFGRDMYAVGSNREAAEAAGIRTNRIILFVYLISGFCAALAAILTAGRQDAVTPLTGYGWIFQVQAACVIGGVSLFGGRGNLIGAMGGVLLWGIIDTGLNLLRVPPLSIDIFKGLLLLFAVFVDAMKVRYLHRLAIHDALIDTKVGLKDKKLIVD
jgi:ribose/xylose/arabinose/galactoside ABC-type transport system permease subunit